MTETIQQLKEDIAILQQKLEHLEKPKSDVEEAYKEVYGCYPPTTPSVSNSEDERWSAFRSGYYASKEEYKVEEPKPKTLYWALTNLGSYDEDNCDEIADAVEEWLSDEIEWEYEDRDYDKGWNDALCTIKGKLR